MNNALYYNVQNINLNVNTISDLNINLTTKNNKILPNLKNKTNIIDYDLMNIKEYSTLKLNCMLNFNDLGNFKTRFSYNFKSNLKK